MGPTWLSSAEVRGVWAKALGTLGLLLLGPLVLLSTPLRGLAITWSVIVVVLLVGVTWLLLLSLFIGLVLSQPPGMLLWLEKRLRRWVARFARDPVLVWLQWARQASRPDLAHWYLHQAVAQGSVEAVFQQGVAFLDGGYGAGGQGAALIWLRRAAEKDHPEAAFRLAECLRTRMGQVTPEPQEAERWYQRSAALGFGPAAAWLAHAYAQGDGVGRDDTKARYWSATADRLRPFPAPSRSLLRHDAAPEDPLQGVFAGLTRGLESGADRLLIHRSSRWVLLGGMAVVSAFGLFVVGAFFWAGSSGLFHMPLLLLAPLGLMLAWQAFQLRKDRPRSGRDRLREAAEAGDPAACYELGLAHRKGSPARPRDDLSAAIWFRKAAEAGHPLAMQALAEAYLGGHGVVRDPREAARWAEAARRESTSGAG